MVHENAFFELEPSTDFFRCPMGLFENGEYVNTNKAADFVRKQQEVVGTIGSSGPAPDFLRATPYRCLSDRALSVFQRANLNLSPQFEWVPARIVRKSGKSVGKYWWAKCDRRDKLDVFDYQHSKYTVIPPEGFVRPPKPGTIVYDKVSKWVLRGDLIGSLDFFYGCLVRWYGSPRLKSVVEENNLVGFDFEAVAVSNPFKP